MATHVNIPATGSGDAGPIPVATTDDASGNKHQQFIAEFLTGTTPTPVTSSAPLPVVQTGTPALPTGAATQTTLAAVLAALGTPLQAGGSVVASGTVAISGTVPISASALPLPSGAATQTTLAAVLSALGTPLQAGGSVVASGTVTANLGTLNGAATQTTLASVLSALQGTIAVSGGGVPTDISASQTFSSAGGTLALTGLNGMSTLIMDFESNTTTGLAVAVQGTLDGTNWFVLGTSAIGSDLTVFTAAPTGGPYQSWIAGCAQVRANVVTLSTGSVTINLRAGAGSLPGRKVTASLTGAIPAGANAIGSLTAGSAIIGKVGIDQTTPGTTNLVALAANQSINNAQVAGTAVSTGNGTTDAGTTRVSLSSDSTGQVKLAAGAAAIGSITQLDLVATASITGSAQAATLNLNGQATLQIDCQGTFSATLNVEASVDGVAFIAIPRGLTPSVVTGIPASGTTFTTPVNVFVACAGFSAVRVRCSAYVSGTAVVTLRASQGTGIVALGQALPVGSNVIGALTANQSVNTAQVNGVAPLMGNGVTGTGAMRVSIASDSTGQMAIAPRTTGGYTVNRLISAASTNATSVKTSAGQVYGWSLTNTAAYSVYLKLYNKASAPTVGTDTPFLTIGVAAGATVNAEFGAGIPFGTGIAFAITKLVADTDTTVVILNDLVVNLMYL